MNRKTLVFLLAVFFCHLFASRVIAQCNRTTRSLGNAEVYNTAPVYYTGSGWKLGRVIDKLPAKTLVRICETREIGFFLDKKKWYRIEYGSNRTGWIYAGYVDVSRYQDSRPFVALFSPSAAEAQNRGHASDAAEVINTADIVPSNTDALIYTLAFISMLLGMFGKVTFDELDDTKKISFWNCFSPRKYLRALIVSPFVFLAFLKAGDYALASQTSIFVGACMAFQNGFFWQTVIPQLAKIYSK
jgi:hypothetical protein